MLNINQRSEDGSKSFLREFHRIFFLNLIYELGSYSYYSQHLVESLKLVFNLLDSSYFTEIYSRIRIFLI